MVNRCTRSRRWFATPKKLPCARVSSFLRFVCYIPIACSTFDFVGWLVSKYHEQPSFHVWSWFVAIRSRNTCRSTQSDLAARPITGVRDAYKFVDKLTAPSYILWRGRIRCVDFLSRLKLIREYIIVDLPHSCNWEDFIRELGARVFLFLLL